MSERADVDRGHQRIDHVALWCGDLEAALHFYQDLLGISLHVTSIFRARE